MTYRPDPDDLSLQVQPANPNLTDEARDVLAYIQSLPGNGWLVGQQEPDESVTDEQHYIEDVTGKRPSIRGFDVAEYIIDPIDEAIRSWHEDGQLVTISWHLCRPLTESDFDNVLDDLDDGPDTAPRDMTDTEEATEHFRHGDRSADGELGEELQHSKAQVESGDYYYGKGDVMAALTEGTEEHEWLLDKLAWMADRLEALYEADVPVLWRPYHEMDGGWFWWSNAGPEGLIGLWKQQYEYFVEERGLDNLIWVWSRSHEPKAGWYPGDGFVDITGTDTYRDVYDDLDWEVHYDRLLEVADEKPAALAECDELPDPDDVRERHPFVWTLPWHGTMIRFNDADHIQYVYDHDYTITAADLPEF